MAEDAPTGGTGSRDGAAGAGGEGGQNSGPDLAVSRAARWLAGHPRAAKKVRGAREAPAVLSTLLLTNFFPLPFLLALIPDSRLVIRLSALIPFFLSYIPIRYPFPAGKEAVIHRFVESIVRPSKCLVYNLWLCTP